MPVVTVVVPTYNRADMLAETLQSIEAQRFRDWECVVVDDGSTDNTAEVVNEFCARDPRFRYLRQENAGPSAARNRGIDAARGRYIAFIDSDDQFAPDRLGWQVEALEHDPEVVLVYGDTWQYYAGDSEDGFLCFGEAAERFSGWAFKDLLQEAKIYAPLVRAQSIRDLGGFDVHLPYAEDWEMWLRLAQVGKVAFEPRVSTYYRIHGGNRSGLHAGDGSGASYREYVWARRIVRRQLRGFPIRERVRLTYGVRRYLRRGYTGRLLQDAANHARSGDLRQAVKIGFAVLTLNMDQPEPLLRGVWRAIRVRIARVRPQSDQALLKPGSGE